MILTTLVTSQLHFEMCAGLYGHPVYQKTSYLALPLLGTTDIIYYCPQNKVEWSMHSQQWIFVLAQ